MNWIHRHRIALNVTAGVSILLFGLEWLWARNFEELELAPWQLGVGLLPPMIFWASWAPIMYLSWFGAQKRGVLVALQKLFYWCLIAVMAVVFAVLYAFFVFGGHS